MKILFVTNEVPYPPDNGVRIVSFNSMRLMHETGHSVCLAVLSNEIDSPEERLFKVNELFNTQKSWRINLPQRNPVSILFKALIKNTPFFVERYRSISFRLKLIKLIDQFRPDVIHFDTIPMIQYRDIVPGGIGTVASINDSCSLSLKNYLHAGLYKNIEFIYRFLQYKQVKQYEASVYSRFNRVHVMSDIDAEYILKIDPRIEVSVIPNGVNDDLLKLRHEDSYKWDLIFVGKLGQENLWYLHKFLKFGWPLVRAAFPELQFNVVGRFDSRAETVINAAKKIGHVHFVGYVNDLKCVYQKSGISVVPVNKNCGLINKAIEGMAAGMAVVGFANAFSGITEAIQGVHFVSAENYDSMGRKIVNLLINKNQAIKMRESAQKLASEFYSWKSRADDYEKMYKAASDEAKRSL